MELIPEFFINLNRSLKRNKEMQLKFPNAKRIEAIDGEYETPQSILPYISNRSWRDPYHNRRMTKGEIGCVLSHIYAWKKCVELDKPILVFEDDIQINNKNYQQLIRENCLDYNFVWLSKKHIEGEIKEISDNLETGGFYYWANAYYLTPKAANAFLDYSKVNELIPADELIPAALNQHRTKDLNVDYNLKSSAFKENLFSPTPNAFDESSTETPTNIWKDFDFKILTVGTDSSKVTKLTDNPNHEILNLGEGVEWKGGDMSKGPGGGQKINLVKNCLKELHPEDIIMFVDGYDTFIHAEEYQILERYFSFSREVVFSAEKVCWPDSSISDKFSIPKEGGYRFLNSGTYIGTVKELQLMFTDKIENHEDDQLYAQKQYLSNKYDVCLDHESYLFACLSGIEDFVVYNNEWFVNTDTNCTTCVIHGNGGDYTKLKFENLYNLPLPRLNYLHYKDYYLDHLDTDIPILKNLISKEWCRKLITACEEDGKWRSLPNDKFPGQEIRLNTLEDQRWIEQFRNFYNTTLRHASENYWPVLKMHELRDVFVIKYSGESQTSLPLHHDMSLVSFACKLNTNYSGGELNFPRQKVSNINLEEGDIIMWPAQVTHPHESLPMKHGTKYGLVVWTGRHDNDTEYFEKR